MASPSSPHPCPWVDCCIPLCQESFCYVKHPPSPPQFLLQGLQHRKMKRRSAALSFFFSLCGPLLRARTASACASGGAPHSWRRTLPLNRSGSHCIRLPFCCNVCSMFVCCQTRKKQYEEKSDFPLFFLLLARAPARTVDWLYLCRPNRLIVVF